MHCHVTPVSPRINLSHPDEARYKGGSGEKLSQRSQALGRRMRHLCSGSLSVRMLGAGPGRFAQSGTTGAVPGPLPSQNVKGSWLAYHGAESRSLGAMSNQGRREGSVLPSNEVAGPEAKPNGSAEARIAVKGSSSGNCQSGLGGGIPPSWAAVCVRLGPCSPARSWPRCCVCGARTCPGCCAAQTSPGEHGAERRDGESRARVRPGGARLEVAAGPGLPDPGVPCGVSAVGRGVGFRCPVRPGGGPARADRRLCHGPRGGVRRPVPCPRESPGGPTR